jgi:hypothetical protein
MSHLNTAFKLGAVNATDAFTQWLQQEADNPTGPPPKLAADIAVEKVLKKLGSKCSTSHTAPKKISRTPAAKKSGFGALKKKLKKKK